MKDRKPEWFDTWVVIKFTHEGSHFYKILAGNSGGYLDGDSWQLNSGIVRVTEDGDYLNFYGASGSCYRVHKDSYGFRMSTIGVWEQIQKRFSDKVELMDNETDWVEMDWNLD